MLTRDYNDVFTEFVEVPYEHPAASATVVFHLRTVQRPMRVKLAEYINPTGYTQDAANYYTINLLKNSTVVASWSCLTGAQGTIAADTFVDLVLSATDTDAVYAVGDILALQLVKTASAANLPLGRMCVHALYV